MTIRASLTHDHGSPPCAIKLLHAVLGEPDLDPGSDPKWNASIRARRIITEAEDARVTPWFHDAPLPNRLLTDRTVAPDGHRGETLWCNPPNNHDGSLVAFYWRTIVEYYLRGFIRSAMFLGFNVEQIARLQRVGARRHPLQFPTVVPAERFEFLDGETLQPQTDAMHANFICLLSRDRREIETFAALGSELGAVINGDRF